MPVSKNRPESFNERASHVVSTPCWMLKVSNYGERKTSWTFYTRSESYAEVKKKVILNISPDAVIEIVAGTIDFKQKKRAE